ncbi:fimbrial protein [Paraburkholderia caballeronis]|uniref:fimbrial protein n=2 Tax=Paraburkholderia caballeronis TaxID=416943 RepID=UPI001064D23A|nr:fimbrial protein [Paraburkholderia caballeronis]TDV16458.1 major type 1 subunit fimbrin (pilin) [Paraburkholderia caballeronis]TDV18854.1 major type 1 subunit fimbrin (pilin) [Paraburkholderia caballeronis]TDV26987.1 major type 1 subunit fimbrin (pilin) [Paraburkholderia caballeronis]TDV35652.1 major type 1 subunit fimbrin (pilin) [Paraburkholderia caballeronis]
MKGVMTAAKTGATRLAALTLAFVTAVALVRGDDARAATSASVTLNFTGTYIGSTCNVIGASDMTVTLPTMSAQSLATAGQTAGSTVFSIPIQCDSETTGVRAYFENGPATDPATGNLNLQAVDGQSSAQNVQVALQNIDGSPIRIGDRSTVKVIPVAATTPTTISFIATYYATGMASPGVVRAFVTYVLELP